MAAENTDFEKGVLDYIAKSNSGSDKLGVGALSISSKQKGNEDLAKALIEAQRAKNSDTTEALNSVGKQLFDKLESIAAKGIAQGAGDQKRALEQIKIFERLLPLVEEGTESQKAAKDSLRALLQDTKGGLMKNSGFKARFIEFAKFSMPAVTGIIGGIASRSPLLGAALNFGLEKLMERSARRKEAEAENIETLVKSIEESDLGKKGAKRKDQIGDKYDAMGGKSGLQITDQSAEKGLAEGIEDGFRAELMGLSGGNEEVAEAILKQVLKEVDETSEEAQVIRAILEGGEEVEREAERLAKNNIDVLESISENIANLTEMEEESVKKEEKGGGFFGWLKGLFTGTGGAVGGIGKIIAGGGLLALIGGFLKKYVARVLGAVTGMLGKGGGLLKGIAGKLLSFPVVFLGGVIKGVMGAVEEWNSGGTLGSTVMKGISDFADWFLFGQLEKIKELIGDSLDGVFAAGESVIASISETAVSGWDAVKGSFTDVFEAVLNPVEAIKAKLDEAGSVFDTVVRTFADPAYFKEKLTDISTGFRKFLMGMIPPWAIRFMPASIQREWVQARKGSADEKPKSITEDGTFFEPGQGPSARAQSSNSPTRTGGGRGAPIAETDSELIQRVLEREGGFVNDPADSGGATNMGITRATLSDYLGKRASVEDVQNLDPEMAKEIYYNNYLKPFADVKDAALKELLFDTGVNMGPPVAKKFLEQTEGLEGEDRFNAVVGLRQKRYDSIVENKPSQARFQKGWNRRLAELAESGRAFYAKSMQDGASAVAKNEATRNAKMTAAAVASVAKPSVNSSVVNNSNSTTHVSKSPVNPFPTAQLASAAA